MSDDYQNLDSLIFHMLDECQSYKAIKKEYMEWCERNNVQYSFFDFQDAYDRITAEEIR